MQEIWIITQDEEMAASIRSGLGRSDEYQICSIDNVECRPAVQTDMRPDVLIVDLETAGPNTDKLLKYRMGLHPEVAHVALAPEGRQPIIDPYLQYGVDEVIRRPSDPKQVGRMITHLRQSLAGFDRFSHLRKKLLMDMRENQIVARSKPMRDIMHKLPQLAATSSSVLISGETGTGKELFARAIHYLGPRAGKPFITVDCGALPENLVENELFGHVRGAYTDAGPPSQGLIREADGGTLFLDEIEALPIQIQPKLLRFLQERQLKPLGQPAYVPVDVRVLTATNTDLMQAVRQKKFREDLYYRLSVAPLIIPPLRDRKSDISALAHHFLRKHTDICPRTPTEIPSEILQCWLDHDWPGNVRELENRVQEWLLFGNPEEAPLAPDASQQLSECIRPLAEVREEALTRCDRVYLQNLLTHTNGNLSAAAKLSKMNRKSIRRLIQKYGIDKVQFHN